MKAYLDVDRDGIASTHWRRAIPSAVLLGIYALLAVCLFSSAWRSPTDTWAGERIDPRLFMWYLGWVPHRLVQGHSPLTSDFIMFPPGVNLMWNTSMVLPALVLAPITASLGVVFTYNLLTTASLVLSAWCGYLAARRYVGNAWLAGVAGGIYGFSPYMLGQSLDHPHMTALMFPALSLIVLDEILVRRRKDPFLLGALAGLLAACQLLIGEEVLALTALAGLIGVLIATLANPKRVSGVALRALRAGLAALPIAAALAAYPLAVQFFGRQRLVVPLQQNEAYVSDLLAFVLPPPTVALNTSASDSVVAHFSGGVPENGAYIGVPLLLFFLVATVACWRRPFVRCLSLVTLALMVLSLGPRLHVNGVSVGWILPWEAVRHLPFLSDALPVRLMGLAFLGVGIVFASLLETLARRGRWARGALIGAVLLVLIPLLPRLPYPATYAEVPAFFKAGGDVARVPADSVAVVTPYSFSGSSDAMLWQAEANYRFKMPEGYSFIPPLSLSPPPSALGSALVALDSGKDVKLTPELRQAALGDLASWHIQTVVSGPSPNHVRTVDFFTGLLDRPPEQTGGVDIWWQVA